MQLTPEQLQNLAKCTVKCSDIYAIRMNETMGITPKGNDKDRLKYFIVLGIDDNNNVFGGVVINSSIDKVPKHLQQWNIPLQCYRYSFLKKDSNVNCQKIKVVPIEQFYKWTKLGNIDKTDIDIITKTLQSSPLETKENLKRFGL